MFAAACGGGPGSVAGLSQPQPQVGLGVLTGRVTRGPLSPVEGIPGGRRAEVVAGFRIVISGSDGRQVESVVTNDQGQYQVNLPSGTYRISAGALPRGSSTKDLPTTVTVRDGQETRLDIRVDTGIR
jgi:hypothetical protein